MGILLRPFAFLTVRHPSGLQVWVNFIIPILLAVAMIVGFGWFVSAEINVWGESGLVSRILSLVQGFPGFYIAALAAVVAFSSDSLKKPMPGEPPVITIPYNGGHIVDHKLSRQMFMVYLFSYLTALSFLICIFAIFGLSLAPVFLSIVPEKFLWLAKALATFGILFFLNQMIVITLWGLYYLGERMHLMDT